MRVGVVGSGVVGRTLATGFVEAGHVVKVGSRSPASDELQAWQKAAGKKGSTGSFADAAAHGEVVVLAVQGAAAEQVLDLVGPANLKGKLLIDVTNALDFSKGMPPGLFVGVTDSLGERIQRKVPEARVVKCFNTVPNTQMVHPHGQGGPPDMLICGNDAAAKAVTVGILKSFGWPGAIDLGGIDGARWLEALVPLWVRVGGALNTWDHAFKVVRG
jgi:8-hydroxy-5-deazaflavin:NADPH oxidoreductase